VAREAVISRWGNPERDPQVSGGAFRLAVHRFGNVAVGIQPARGYQIDPRATYHDPDLVPPHHYLAFYAWLRLHFRADALVHVGKHGNLEWLPGKALGLSDACWPEIALGPLPVVYPFIVNDPGEGSQAKRRMPAVIIDHLMPAMARAETYGPLAELETLIDEYYQAVGADARRRDFLRREIVALAGRTGLDRDLGLDLAGGAGLSADAAPGAGALQALDAHLCELKELQIRDGLHVLGRSPAGPERVSTLVAIARVPRSGGRPEDASLHRALAADLGLGFDPLDCEFAAPWQGPRPEPLSQLSPALWRTEGDTVERLELLAAAMVAAALGAPSPLSAHPRESGDRGALGSGGSALEPGSPLSRGRADGGWRAEGGMDGGWVAGRGADGVPDAERVADGVRGAGQEADGVRSSPLSAHPRESGDRGAAGAAPGALPRSAPVLDWIAGVLAPSLDACGRAEIAAVLAALDGRFVPPGPSGAPTRGRAEVLPTGRNFYSLDIRGVPTEAAWTLGRMAADAVALRHFQDEGEWPRSLAISAWGTANMRTGGDDIAEVLAFIGARPAWERGTGRVTGFAVMPLAELGRPRIDVTLRISGMFRDAFPLQIDLIDSAIRAVAALEEPDEANPLAAARRAAEAEGADDDALRRAGSRIFGAKPGSYGAGLQALIDSGAWDRRGDFAEAFLAWGGFAYGAGSTGETAPELLAERLRTVEAVVHNQDNREHDILDSDDYYQFQGGLAAAVETLRGRAPRLYHGDHSRPEKPVARSLAEEVARVVRGRAANPKWIAGVMRHGYKGAFEIAATVDYLFAFAATTDAVGDHHFDLLYDAYLGDAAVRSFIAEANPPALAEIAARFREAIDRGLWQPAANSAYDRLSELIARPPAPGGPT
jgi:cobaltochelatase CobN